jgi:hypothetical protein
MSESIKVPVRTIGESEKWGADLICAARQAKSPGSIAISRVFANRRLTR